MMTPRPFIPAGFALIAVLIVALLPHFSLAAQLVPGVYGYGTDRANNTAGFGPGSVIVPVTSLANGGPGTLREAVIKDIPGDPPRVIVFHQSGVINLQTQLTIEKPNVTIAGQTAPSPGIALHGAPLVVGANEVLIQHIRVRPGDTWSETPMSNITTNRDAVVIADGVANVIFDHCTFAWSLDELAQGYYKYDNITFNRCIFAEPLHLSIHLDEDTFVSNFPVQAEALNYTSSGLPNPPTTQMTDSLAVNDGYERVNANGENDYIEYTLPLEAADDPRTQAHITIVGITGTDRGRFEVLVYIGSSSTPLPVSETFDQYDTTPERKTYIAQTPEFIIPANEDTLRIRLRITGKNSASSNYRLGIDQISISRPHGMGPYFLDGNRDDVEMEGKLSIIGSIIAHVQARGPWVGSKQFVFANNVLYNRRQQMVMLGVTTAMDPMNAALIGNTFIEGRSWVINEDNPIIKNVRVPSGSSIYLHNNDYKAGITPVPDLYNGTSALSDPTTDDDGMAGFIPQSAQAGYASTVLYAGARPADRDTMEHRIANDISVSAGITNYTQRQGELKDTVIEAGGWPDYLVVPKTWNTPLNPNADDGSEGHIPGNGYTNVEEWLQSLSNQLKVSPSSPPTPGAIQAETGTLAGGSEIEDVNSGFAGTGYINFLTGSPTNSTLTFNNVNGGTGGTRILRIRHAFASASARTGQLVINGTPQAITFNPTGSFTTWLNKDVTVTLNSSANTIAFRATGQDLANIDEMAVFTPSVYQAESGTVGGGAAVESNVAGYHGTGFVNFLTGSPTPSTVTFSNVQGGTGGSKMLRIRYGLGSTGSRTGELVINGDPQPITFVPSGAFTTWITHDVPVTLNAGTANTIIFKATGQDLANIDELLVY